MKKQIYSVVFGNDHKNPLGVIQSLGQAGIKSIAVCWGPHTGTLETSNFLKDIHFGESPEACIDILMTLIPDNELGVITPCCDQAALVIDKYRTTLEKKYRFEYSTKYTIEELSDKGLQTRLAGEAGLCIPEFYTILSMDEVPENPPYPCIVKPLVAMRGSKADLRVCKDRNELIKNLEEVLPHNNGVILQRYIDKEHEILIECCRTSKGDTITPCIIKNELSRLYPPQVGLSGLHEVIPFEECELKNKISKLLDLMGYVGLISVEFAKSASTGQYYFFEFNIRNDGYNPCMTKSGANINYYYICDMMDVPFEIKQPKHVFIISEIRHLELFAHGLIRFNDWVGDLLKAKGFTWYYKNDKKPFYFMLKHCIMGSVKNRLKKLKKRCR